MVNNHEFTSHTHITVTICYCGISIFVVWPYRALSMDSLTDGLTANNAVRDDEAVVGSSIKLSSANNSWIDLGNHQSACFGNTDKCSNGFTLYLWLHIIDFPYIQNIIISSGSTGYTIYGYDSKIAFSVTTEDAIWTREVDIVYKTWMFLVFQWNEQLNYSSIYLNGLKVEDPYESYQTNTGLTETVYGNVAIGVIPQNVTGEAMSFDGYVDELYFWDYLVSSGDIWSTYIDTADGKN